MRVLLKLVTFIFHPLGIPFWGSLIYFQLSPRFFPANIVKAKLLAIIILTIFIPIIFLFLLKSLGITKSMHLKKINDRKLPLLFFSLILVTVINFILQDYTSTSLYYFFNGLLFSSISIALFNLFNKPVSIHVAGISNLTFFTAGLGLLFQTNLALFVAALVFSIGLVASSRIALHKHKGRAVLLGFICGGFPQVLLFVLEVYLLHKI